MTDIERFNEALEILKREDLDEFQRKMWWRLAEFYFEQIKDFG